MTEPTQPGQQHSQLATRQGKATQPRARACAPGSEHGACVRMRGCGCGCGCEITRQGIRHQAGVCARASASRQLRARASGCERIRLSIRLQCPVEPLPKIELYPYIKSPNVAPCPATGSGNSIAARHAIPKPLGHCARVRPDPQLCRSNVHALKIQNCMREIGQSFRINGLRYVADSIGKSASRTFQRTCTHAIAVASMQFHG